MQGKHAEALLYSCFWWLFDNLVLKKRTVGLGIHYFIYAVVVPSH
jgi:hypothetical protein